MDIVEPPLLNKIKADERDNLPVERSWAEWFNKVFRAIEALMDLVSVLSATASLNFGSINGGAQEDLTITVTGAAVGDAVALGLPAAPAAGIVFNAFVSATNTVTIRASNITGMAVNPASATYRVTVFHY